MAAIETQLHRQAKQELGASDLTTPDAGDRFERYRAISRTRALQQEQAVTSKTQRLTAACGLGQVVAG